MQVNTSTSATLPLASQPSSKSISTPEDDNFMEAFHQGKLGIAFTFDPELANTTHNNIRYVMPPPNMVSFGTQELAEKMTGLKGKEAQEQFAKTMALLEQGVVPDPAVLEKQLQKQADSIFRSPAGEVLAVVYKDGTIHTQGEGMRIDFDALFKSAKGLSEHEYRAAMRNGIAAALGSRAIASYYDYHQLAPTMREINEEERIFYSRA